MELELAAQIGVDATENLNSSYGYYIDESAWDNMADTFASTGSKEITGAGVYVGQDRIRKVLKLRGPMTGRSANFFTIHQLVQPVIHVSADARTARARLRLFQDGGNADGSSGSWIGGTYENTAVFENGEWKFGVQDLHHSFNASYRNGWARLAESAGKPLEGSRFAARCARWRHHPGPGWRRIGAEILGGVSAGLSHPLAAVFIPGNRGAGVPLRESRDGRKPAVLLPQD